MKSLKRRIAEYKVKRRGKVKYYPKKFSGLLERVLGMLTIIIALSLAPFNSEGLYRAYYERWKEPVFHWLLKREHENKNVPEVLKTMAWEKLLLYRQMEAEIEFSELEVPSETR